MDEFSNSGYLNMELLRFTTAGSVDDGKSTLIGRLLYDTKSIFDDQYDAIVRTSETRGEDYVNLALLTDGLRAEREQASRSTWLIATLRRRCASLSLRIRRGTSSIRVTWLLGRQRRIWRSFWSMREKVLLSRRAAMRLSHRCCASRMWSSASTKWTWLDMIRVFSIRYASKSPGLSLASRWSMCTIFRSVRLMETTLSIRRRTCSGIRDAASQLA